MLGVGVSAGLAEARRVLAAAAFLGQQVHDPCAVPPARLEPPPGGGDLDGLRRGQGAEQLPALRGA